MKIAAHILVFGCDLTLLQMLRNIGPHVDHVYAAYSNLPFNARNAYRNPTPLSVFERSEFRHKTEIIEGDWTSEQDQRNECLQRARTDGFELMLCVDADEFYLDEDYPAMLAEVALHPEAGAFNSPYITFWKSLSMVIHGRKGIMDTGNAMFAIRCSDSLTYTSGRSCNSSVVHMLSAPCYHLGYVLSDEDMRRKINTWHHAADFNRDWWYRVKWLGWTAESRNLHPLYPALWPKTVRYEGDLPGALEGFVVPAYSRLLLSKRQRLQEMGYDVRVDVKHFLRPYWRCLRYGTAK